MYDCINHINLIIIIDTQQKKHIYYYVAYLILCSTTKSIDRDNITVKYNTSINTYPFIRINTLSQILWQWSIR